MDEPEIPIGEVELANASKRQRLRFERQQERESGRWLERIQWLEHDTGIVQPLGHLPADRCPICFHIRRGMPADEAVAALRPRPNPARPEWR